MSNPIHIFEGIWWSKSDGSVFVDNIPFSLDEFIGKRVTISLHHWPNPSGVYCFKGLSCQQHGKNPAYLLNWKKTGVLSPELEVGDHGKIPLSEVIGHNSRLIVLNEEFEVNNTNSSDPQDLINDAQELSKILQGLKQTLRSIK